MRLPVMAWQMPRRYSIISSHIRCSMTGGGADRSDTFLQFFFNSTPFDTNSGWQTPFVIKPHKISPGKDVYRYHAARFLSCDVKRFFFFYFLNAKYFFRRIFCSLGCIKKEVCRPPLPLTFILSEPIMSTPRISLK